MLKHVTHKTLTWVSHDVKTRGAWGLWSCDQSVLTPVNLLTSIELKRLVEFACTGTSEQVWQIWQLPDQ